MDKELHMRLPLKGLALIGMYPLKTKNIILGALYKFHQRFVFTYFTMFVLSQYVYLYFNMGDMSLDQLELLCVCLLYSTTIAKLRACLHKNMRSLLEQIQNTEKIIMDGTDEIQKDIYLKHVKYNDIISTIIYIIGVVTLAPFVVNPYFDYLAQGGNLPNSTYVKTLPFRSWFPFDKNEHYALAYTLHVLFGCFGATLTVTTDAFLWGNMVFLIGQLKILHYKLRNFVRHAEELRESNKHMSVDTAQRISVKKCALLHKLLISFIEKLDSSMNLLMLMDFIICSIQMGASGIRIMVVNDLGFSFISAIEFLGAMLVQMMFFYWHANEITLESNRIPMSIWESEWYNSSNDVKRSLNFITLRAQKPLTLNIGPFYPMSTMTAISICKAAYSYVALMRQM